MKRKIVLLLFALPFFAVGVWMIYSIGNNALDAWQMQHWTPVQARLLSAGYRVHSGDDSDSYEAFADYAYQINGQEYRGTRVSISGSADNIGDFQQDLGNRLSNAMNQGGEIIAYANPDDPTEAVIDRTLRWGLLGFKSIFLFTFGGVGLGLIIYALRAPKEKDLSDPKYVVKPWLANDAWQTSAIKSSSKATMYFTWGFAAFWNLVSAPLPFVVYREVVEKENKVALVGLLFTAVGIWLITWAVQRTREWRRFGAAPVSLDPFPGAIGGHVGGLIELNLPYDSAAKFSVTLTSVRSYMSGGGKNRSRKESANWQDTQVAHAELGTNGTRLSFRFDVPQNLAESDADQSGDDYDLWRLSLKGELAGVDLDRDYEIPVYATGEESRHLSNFSIDQARAEQGKLDRSAIGRVIDVAYGASGPSMYFPMGRNLLAGVSGLVFGAVFAGIGWFLIKHEGHVIMGSVFGVVGVVILTSALYYALNSLEVTQVGDELRTLRRVLGVPVKRRYISRSNFVRFNKKSSMQSQSGTKHVMYYSVRALDRAGHEIVVAEGLKGDNQADAAIELIAREFGLVPRQGSPLAEKHIVERNDDGYDFLTSDS